MKITKSKFPNLHIIGLGFLNIFDGLVMVLTLGNFTSQTTFNYVINYHKKLRIKQKENGTKTN